MSSIAAGLFMVHLAPLGVFSFATTAVISTATVVKLCAYQIVPELVLDFYVTFMEIYGGLKEMHASYWRTDTGADNGSRFWMDRVGDMPKSTILKAMMTWCLITFILMVCLR